jgi:hypothetical protein
MELKDYIDDLFKHMEWADATLWTSVLDSAQTLDDSLIFDRLYHIHSVQRAFLYIWHAIPINVPPHSEFTDLNAMLRWTREYYDEITKFTEELGGKGLNRNVIIPGSERVEQKY